MLRFIELTDLSCALIVCNDKGIIDYEKRSKRFFQSLTHDFINRQDILGTTLTYEWINGIKNETKCDILLNDWYKDLPVDVPAFEAVIELGYNGKYLTLIEPKIIDIDDYIYEHTKNH